MAELAYGSGGLRIGIDARAAAEVLAGRGRLVRDLLLALEGAEAAGAGHEFVLFGRSAWGRGALGERFRWRLIDGPDGVWHLRVAAAVRDEVDVFLATNSYLSALFNPVATVTVVYDLVAFERSLGVRRRSAVTERTTLGLAVRRSAGLWCISEATAAALTRRVPRAAGKVEVIWPGVSPELAQVQAVAGDLPAPGFVLSVGTLEPRKNLPRLVEAYRLLPTTLQEAHPLVVVGARGWGEGETLRALESLGGRARILGRVSDRELRELYRRCAVFCYPSLAEGFGLPVLEAMAAGAAVLTSGVSSLPEVGGDAVEYADPRSVDCLSDALRRLLDDDARRAELSALAASRARQFRWEEAAERVLNMLERAARSGEEVQQVLRQDAQRAGRGGERDQGDQGGHH